MKMKQYHRYRMDFGGKWLHIYCLLCGWSFFFRVAYYFMLVNPVQCPASEAIFCMILPLLLTTASLVILKYFKLNAPGIMGIIGTLMCLSLLIGTFFSGNVLRIILSLVFYAGGGALLFLTILGFVPTNQFAVLAFCVIFLIRILFFRPGFSLFDWVQEFSELTMLASLILLPLTMVPGKPKKRL